MSDAELLFTRPSSAYDGRGGTDLITGAHALIYSPQADAIRALFRDVLGMPYVDSGGGWLIFALPPAEIGVHPSDDNHHEISLMCDDLDATMAELGAKGVRFAHPPRDDGYGIVTAIVLPGGGQIQLYQPRHPIAAGLKKGAGT